jgi:hypothetical protein
MTALVNTSWRSMSLHRADEGYLRVGSAVRLPRHSGDTHVEDGIDIRQESLLSVLRVNSCTRNSFGAQHNVGADGVLHEGIGALLIDGIGSPIAGTVGRGDDRGFQGH